MLLTALLVLAIVASSALVFTNRVELLKLAVIVALWAAVVAAFVSFIYRRQADLDQAKSRDLKLVYDLQLDREISARREYELSVETQLRRELASELRAQASDEVASLRAELAALRANLEIIFDTDLQEPPGHRDRAHQPSLASATGPGAPEGTDRVISSRIDADRASAADIDAEATDAPDVRRPQHRGKPDHRRARGAATARGRVARRIQRAVRTGGRRTSTERADTGWRPPAPAAGNRARQEPPPHAPPPPGPAPVAQRAPAPAPRPSPPYEPCRSRHPSRFPRCPNPFAARTPPPPASSADAAPTPQPVWEPSVESSPSARVSCPWSPSWQPGAPRASPAEPAAQAAPAEPTEAAPPVADIPPEWRLPPLGDFTSLASPNRRSATAPRQSPYDYTPRPFGSPEPAMTTAPAADPPRGRHSTASEAATAEAARRGRHSSHGDPNELMHRTPPPTLAAPAPPTPPPAPPLSPVAPAAPDQPRSARHRGGGRAAGTRGPAHRRPAGLRADGSSAGRFDRRRPSPSSRGVS